MPQAFQTPYLHFTVICLLFFFISFYFFASRFGAAFRQLRRKWNPPTPYDPRLLKYQMNAALLWSIFVVIGALLLLLAWYLSTYQWIGQKVEMAGEAQLRGGVVEFASVDGEQMKERVKGAQAAAAGIFIRFHKNLNFLGLQTYHKVLTFRGNGENIYHYRPPEPVWLGGYLDSFSLFLYKQNSWIKITDTAYIESPYFGGGGKKEILVTPKGYIIK